MENDVWMHLNDEIKVRLTDMGLRIISQRNEQFENMYPHALLKPALPNQDEHGYFHFLLWEFMELYGSTLYMGNTESPIWPLEIHLVKHNVKEPAIVVKGSKEVIIRR